MSLLSKYVNSYIQMNSCLCVNSYNQMNSHHCVNSYNQMNSRHYLNSYNQMNSLKLYLFFDTRNFHYCENYLWASENHFFLLFILRPYISTFVECTINSCNIAKLRRIRIDLCKSRLVTIETPRNHSLSQHQIIFSIVEKYIGIVTNINFKSHWM